MQMFRTWLEQGIITQADYAKAEQLMREKYHPLLGTLFFDIALT
ncbi:SHOCT domain-containing protein [Selenomonas caprae]|nr:SHOCT domain-containing protein [Selenomonas caprae]